MEKNMFCYQCQETAKGIGCTLKGVCGKESHTAQAMDLLLFVVRGISVVADAMRKADYPVPEEVNGFVVDALFCTITNANFDDESILKRVDKGIVLRNRLIEEAKKNRIFLPESDELVWQGTRDEYAEKAATVGIMREPDEDLRSLKELLTYGLKGLAAYLEHAMRLGFNDDGIHAFVQHALAAVACGSLSADEWVRLVLETGEYGVKTMSLLDAANTRTYGNPEITKVNIGVKNRPGILISGHDLKDMEELLKQTEGTGVDVYTHGEMLPAHYYPAFKKYPHFVGNYGNAWWKQREEFTSFNGPILFTTNCIVPPLTNAVYKERMFTTNSAGYPGCKHIEKDAEGKKDFSGIIEMARQCQPPTEIERGEIVGGFAHNQVLLLADKIVDAVKTGAISRFIVMAGCDGRMKNRDYYAEFARKLPHDTVILTAGCAKYRYNKLGLGDINGIPRVLDAGQCNDSYSLAVIALKLKEVFRLNDINELPIVYNIAWYEQKAVIVLLALLSLGVKEIHLGPTLPAFLSPNVAKVLVETFHIAGIGSVEDDLKKFGLAS
ncbi:hydroxylamine reductase [Bacteroides helcogenes]|uniref:Hydroxylamine reductase n=1 Tax=Bacteroides helcogenes (strain ATCC 35417 / DSM 20613 / JCM 6297 / CCUG 15421 / P 36-108) TaxID=693979 RepID=E6SP66_BACT6|nr:hydroxylamine reductase [Bacteroides helcogenes]ADV43836.1 hybrid cluster protein [Bacteroides helcogenes P 36-108]MDY5237466.1 hydroxylamine reductase [Bacteroides helcogenes]